MPQMAPLNWLNLMIMFTLLILFMNSMNFFYKTYSIKFNKKNELKKNNWKW